MTSSCSCITPIQIVQTSVKLKMSVDTLWLIWVRDTTLVKKKKSNSKYHNEVSTVVQQKLPQKVYWLGCFSTMENFPNALLELTKHCLIC